MQTPWAGRVGLLLLKMRKTVDGVKEQMGSWAGEGAGGGGICLVWDVLLICSDSQVDGGTAIQGSQVDTHTHILCVYVCHMNNNILDIENCKTEPGRENRVNLSLKVYEELDRSRGQRKLPGLRRRGEEAGGPLGNLMCWSLDNY